MADALGGFGEDVSDRTLVLNVIRRLNEKFAQIGVHLRRGRPFPTFLEARNELLFDELTISKSAPDSSTALLASAPGVSGTAVNRQAPSQQPLRTNSGGSSNGAGGAAPKQQQQQRRSGGNGGNRRNGDNQRSKSSGSGGNNGNGGRSPSSGASPAVPPGLVVTWPGLQLWPGARQAQHQALLA